MNTFQQSLLKKKCQSCGTHSITERATSMKKVAFYYIFNISSHAAFVLVNVRASSGELLFFRKHLFELLTVWEWNREAEAILIYSTINAINWRPKIKPFLKFIFWSINFFHIHLFKYVPLKMVSQRTFSNKNNFRLSNKSAVRPSKVDILPKIFKV